MECDIRLTSKSTMPPKSTLDSNWSTKLEPIRSQWAFFLSKHFKCIGSDYTIYGPWLQLNFGLGPSVNHNWPIQFGFNQARPGPVLSATDPNGSYVVPTWLLMGPIISLPRLQISNICHLRTAQCSSSSHD